MNNLHLAVQFFIQIAVILLFCRLVGAVAVRLGQPQVVAEMVAGVLLGPSLFGLVWPEAQHWVFPWDKTQTLMELIIINIGLQRGIISEGLFALLVIMAVVTTLMASPIFERLVGPGTYQPTPEGSG